jgi:hypothetical protein
VDWDLVHRFHLGPLAAPRLQHLPFSSSEIQWREGAGAGNSPPAAAATAAAAHRSIDQ